MKQAKPYDQAEFMTLEEALAVAGRLADENDRLKIALRSIAATTNGYLARRLAREALAERSFEAKP